ncbi:MAG: hypothetical protein R3F59_09395 [Myxococcota bacterium]
MGREDVLAQQLPGGRPELRLAPAERLLEPRHVVQQRVEPDVADVVPVERQLDAPAHPRLRAADAQVAERLAQEAEHLVAPVLGLDEVGIGRDGVEERLLVLRHAEEPVRLLEHPEVRLGELARGDALLALLVGDEDLVLDEVPAAVLVAVDLAAVEQLLQRGLDERLVIGVGRADEAIVADVEGSSSASRRPRSRRSAPAAPARPSRRPRAPSARARRCR